MSRKIGGRSSQFAEIRTGITLLFGAENARAISRRTQEDSRSAWTGRMTMSSAAASMDSIATTMLSPGCKSPCVQTSWPACLRAVEIEASQAASLPRLRRRHAGAGQAETRHGPNLTLRVEPICVRTPGVALKAL